MAPWEAIPALTSDRLIRVADILRRSRDSAARHAKPKLGDSLCSIGLVAFDRSRYALTLAASDVYKSWLSVEEADNHFIIKIAGIPTRFYRGDPDLPIPARTLKIGPEEQFDTQLAFEGAGMAGRIHCLRFEVEKKAKGYTQSVNFVQVDANAQRIDSWPIPQFVSRPASTTLRKGAVELPPISLDEPSQPKSDEASA
jgi:hypothetical protein